MEALWNSDIETIRKKMLPFHATACREVMCHDHCAEAPVTFIWNITSSGRSPPDNIMPRVTNSPWTQNFPFAAHTNHRSLQSTSMLPCAKRLPPSLDFGHPEGGGHVGFAEWPPASCIWHIEVFSKYLFNEHLRKASQQCPFAILR